MVEGSISGKVQLFYFCVELDFGGSEADSQSLVSVPKRNPKFLCSAFALIIYIYTNILLIWIFPSDGEIKFWWSFYCF